MVTFSLLITAPSMYEPSDIDEEEEEVRVPYPAEPTYMLGE